MKYLNLLFFILMTLMAVVQYNDPDGLMWALIYGIPTAWAGLTAFRLDRILNNDSAAALSISIAVTLVLTGYYWPATPDFWLKAVWWETESAREGMGMMISSFVILFATLTIMLARRKKNPN
jgi:hypothetical protein